MSGAFSYPIDTNPTADDYILTEKVAGNRIFKARSKPGDLKVTPTGGSAQSLSALLADVGITTAGAANGTGVVATEYGDNGVHKTVLTLTDVHLTFADNGANGGNASLKVYDFPEGAIQLLGASYNLTTQRDVATIQDHTTAIAANAALVGALGSAAAGASNATLTGTEADMIASTTGTLSGGAGTLKSHASLVATAFDGHTTALDMYLNMAIPDAGITVVDDAAGVTVNGTITFVWANLGDY